MFKRQILSIFSLFIFIFVSPFVCEAAIPEEELSIFLEDIGWTREIMELYVERASNETKTLASFQTLDDLASYLGPRITEEQPLQALLDKYGYTRDDVNELLGQYNTSLSEYTFVQELDLDLMDILAERRQTENGGALPETAGNYALFALFGALVVTLGSWLLYRGLTARA